MAKPRKCFKCSKEITEGKFYSFYVGKKGGKRIIKHLLDKELNNFYCPTCFSKEKADPTGVGPENLLEIEWEVGNQSDEEILEFEEKWESLFSEFTKYKESMDEKKVLTWVQKAKKELEPFLQKPQVIAKSFGGKLGDYGREAMSFYYLFSQSARTENYRKSVVEPTIAEVFGVSQLAQEINTTITGSSPGLPGRAAGNFKINHKYPVNYDWDDGQAGIFRRLLFEVFDPYFALQSFCRALTIKERELGGEKLPNQNLPQKTEGLSSGMIFLLIIGGILLLGVIFWLARKRK